MADTAISGLSAVAAVLGTQQIPVNNSGATERFDVDTLMGYIEANSGWRFLGIATANAAVRTGDVLWTGTYQQLRVIYSSPGTAGNAQPRIITGAGVAISETNTIHCAELVEGVTRNTTAVSICGFPVKVAANTAPMFGVMDIVNYNAAGTTLRRGVGHGQHGGTAPTAVPSGMLIRGLINSSTVIDRVRLTSFNGLTGNTTTSTLNNGTFIMVLGRNND